MVVQRVQRRLKLMGQEMIPEIELEIPLSCRALAVEVMNDPKLSHLLYNATGWTLTAASSAFDISGCTTIGGDPAVLLHESLPMSRLLITGWSYPASYYRNRMDLERGTPAATTPRFCVEGESIIARASTTVSGVPTIATIADATSANLKAHFVPFVGTTLTGTSADTTLPDQLLPHLIEVIAGRIMPTGGA